MNVPGMLADLNREIARLTQIRDLLTQTDTPAKPGPSRPKSSGKAVGSARSNEAAPQRRQMSDEAREKIAAAQRRRWAKAAGKRVGTSPAKPGVVKTIRATPPATKQAAPRVTSAKKGTPTKKPVKAPAARKQPAEAIVPPLAASDSGETSANE